MIPQSHSSSEVAGSVVSVLARRRIKLIGFSGNEDSTSGMLTSGHSHREI